MRPYLTLSLFTGILLLSITAFAQQTPQGIPLKKIMPESQPNKPADTATVKGVPQKDLPDVIRELFHGKATPEVDSISTKPQISVVPAIGYTLVSRLALVLSGNVAFRTGPNSRVSTIVASTSYTQNKQFTLPIQTNIWSKDNQWDFVGDYRFMKYPQDTYGLGSSSKMSNVDPMDYFFVRFYEIVLRHVSGNFYAGGGYIFDDHFNISQGGNANGSVSDYTRYGTADRTVSSGFTFNGLFDSRDNAINPSKGGYVNLEFRTSTKFTGSSSNWESVVLDMRKYYNLPEGSDNILALWSYDWIILSGRPGYLDLPSTAWDANSATGRGYIQGRFRGTQMVYAESEYRFKLTANGLLGGVVFLNAESLSAEQGTHLQTIQPGYGPGLRVKLNKISKTNITIDYGFGSQGSRGLFIDVGENF
jgi:hypothetical protein